MILMIRDYPVEYIIDNLEFVRLEQLFYLTKDGDYYYRETFDGRLFPGISDQSNSVFIPRDRNHDTAKYQKEIFDDGKTKKEIKVCVANAVCGFRNGEYETNIIHPSLNAYLCNDNGKTIRVIR